MKNNGIVDFAIDWIKAHRIFVAYFLICCFVTVLDIVVSLVVEKMLVMACGVSNAALVGNAAGVVTGFVVQYILCTKKVYAGSNLRTLVIFFVTWLIGLAFAELIIYVTRTVIFRDAEGLVYFLIGKFFSIALPFFLTYYLRKITIPSRVENTNEQEKQHE